MQIPKSTDPDRAKLAAMPGAGPFGPVERPMVAKARAAAAALPPKPAKKKTAKK